MKFTFKKQPRETGLSSIGHPHPNVDIKLDGKVVGSIDAPTWASRNKGWVIRFTVMKDNINEDGNPNCEWKWVQINKEFETENDAREYIKNNSDQILYGLRLHSIE
jgi:hypothetical protein